MNFLADSTLYKEATQMCHVSGWHSLFFDWSNKYSQDLTSNDQRWSYRVGITPLFFLMQFDYFWSKVWRNTLNVIDSKMFCPIWGKKYSLCFTVLLKIHLQEQSTDKDKLKEVQMRWHHHQTVLRSCSSSPQDLLIISFLTCHHLSSYQAPFSLIVFL